MKQQALHMLFDTGALTRTDLANDDTTTEVKVGRTSSIVRLSIPVLGHNRASGYAMR